MIYVDKDRAAAVIIGDSKDLKSAMRGKRRRDRTTTDSNVGQLLMMLLLNTKLQHNIYVFTNYEIIKYNFQVADEEVNMATYIMQGEHELK